MKHAILIHCYIVFSSIILLGGYYVQSIKKNNKREVGDSHSLGFTFSNVLYRSEDNRMGTEIKQYCSIPSCHNYQGKYKKWHLCDYHQLQFSIKNMIQEESHKHINTAHPVRNCKVYKLKF